MVALKRAFGQSHMLVKTQLSRLCNRFDICQRLQQGDLNWTLGSHRRGRFRCFSGLTSDSTSLQSARRPGGGFLLVCILHFRISEVFMIPAHTASSQWIRMQNLVVFTACGIGSLRRKTCGELLNVAALLWHAMNILQKNVHNDTVQCIFAFGLLPRSTPGSDLHCVNYEKICISYFTSIIIINYFL